MKKGLRLLPAVEVSFFRNSETSPDEEGIKTTLSPTTRRTSSFGDKP